MEEKEKTRGELAKERLSGGSGFMCPQCSSRLWTVRNTIEYDEKIKRYRVCSHCGYAIRTLETRA